MPIRTYTGPDLIFAQEDTGESGSGVVSVLNQTDITNSANMVADQGANSAIRRFHAYFDFLAFPAIPENALITKITLTMQGSGIAGATGSGQAIAQIALWHIEYIDGDSTLLQEDGDTAAAGTVPVPDFNRQMGWEIIFPDPGISRPELIALFGSEGDYPNNGAYIFLQVIANCESTGSPTSAAATCATEDFQFDVEYSDGPFSYYLEVEEQIVNGEPITVVTDTIIVPEGDDPPVGAVFYGDSEDFPDGPIMLWWASPDAFMFWIESPITPGPDWESVSEPVCPTCITLTLGEMEILLANASGIYQLTKDQFHDVLYDRESGETFTIKIPNPKGKTGYLP